MEAFYSGAERPLGKALKKIDPCRLLNHDITARSGKKFSRFIKKYWKDGLYKRNFVDLSGNNTIKKPTIEQLKEVYKKLHKNSARDMYDCNTCGYGTCYGMAVAIFNGLNRPENCHHYNLDMVATEERELHENDQRLSDSVARAVAALENINALIGQLNSDVVRQSEVVEKSAERVNVMMSTLNNASKTSQDEKAGLDGLVSGAARGKEAMAETIKNVDNFGKDVDEISNMVKVITGIAANTNLLSMNAAIEAAHAGESGKGFAVVADEIRRLSESTSENASNIAKTLKGIVSGLHAASSSSMQTNGLITSIVDEIQGFANTMSSLISTMSELSASSGEITDTLDTLRALSGKVKDSYAQMMDKTNELERNMRSLTTKQE
jgi:ABC-type transporter Mla subunit MlaD